MLALCMYMLRKCYASKRQLGLGILHRYKPIWFFEPQILKTTKKGNPIFLSCLTPHNVVLLLTNRGLFCCHLMSFGCLLHVVYFSLICTCQYLVVVLSTAFNAVSVVNIQFVGSKDNFFNLLQCMKRSVGLVNFETVQVHGSNSFKSHSFLINRNHNSIFEPSHHLKLKKMGQLEDRVEVKKGQPLKTEVQNSLKQEILDLQDRLQDQVLVRRALEKALNGSPFSHDHIMTDMTSIPKSAKEMVKEIAVLELEVVYLERYLLSLYRKIFDQQVSSSLSGKDEKVDERIRMSSIPHKETFPVFPTTDVISVENNNYTNDANHLTSLQDGIGNSTREWNGSWGPAKMTDCGIHRCHSSISHRSTGNSPLTRSTARAADLYHSLPLSMLEKAQDALSNAISLADHLGTSVRHDALHTPNWVSEELVKIISAIYCELADPPLINPDYASSPISVSSSTNELPSQRHDDIWSPQNFSSFNSSLDNPFHIGASSSKEFSGPYCSMAKVHWICRDSQKLRDVQQKLHDFRSLVTQLEEVNPRKMRHEEKLAFWINVHNALAMHAYLVYGIPQNNVKRMSLVLKAAYNIGSHTINLDMIQSSILGCRLLRPGQWLRQLFSSKTKFKAGDARKAYSIDHPEPRLHFALCAGSYSDPAVRVYTPKRIFEDLESAKEEYIQSSFTVQKEKKLLLPKIVESFAKDLDLCPAGLVEMIEHLLPISLRNIIQECQYRKLGKGIEWIPHNFAFRYLLSKELAY